MPKKANRKIVERVMEEIDKQSEMIQTTAGIILGANRTKAKPEAVADFDLRWLKEQNRILKLQLKATPGIISRAVEIANIEGRIESLRDIEYALSLTPGGLDERFAEITSILAERIVFLGRYLDKLKKEAE